MSQQAKEDLGLPPDAALTVVADTGYGTGAQHAACESHGTIALAPVQKKFGEANGLYNSDVFTHRPESDTYLCPQGQVLHRKADTKTNDPNGGFRTYYNAAACKACPARERCTASSFRKLLISVHEESLARAGQRLAESPGMMRTRAGIVEHPFGTIKERLGHGGLLCRGLGLAGAETGLSAWAYNFTRVINLVGAGGLIEAIRCRAMPQEC